MKNTRLQELLNFLGKEPNDPFLIYAVANEYRNSNPLKAKEFYDKLLLQHAGYLATYYHAAHLYVELDNPEKAKAIFEKGIKLANEQKEQLALRELKNAYQNFLFEESD